MFANSDESSRSYLASVKQIFAALVLASGSGIAGPAMAQQEPETLIRYSCAVSDVSRARAAVLSLELARPITGLRDQLVLNVTAWTIDNRQSATLRLASVSDDRMPDVFRVPVRGGLWLGSDAQLLLTRVQVLERRVSDLVVLSDNRAVGYSCHRSPDEGQVRTPQSIR